MKLLACAGCAASLLLASSLACADDHPQLPPPAPPALPPPTPPTPTSPPAASALLTHDPNAVVDTIHLRSGGVVRGRVTDIVTGEHVAILTSTGELRTVPWTDVDRVVVANTDRPPNLPAPRAPKPAPPPPMQPDAPAMVGPFARVHIEASGTTYLYRAPSGTSDFETICEAPCDMDLPINDDYKIGGNGTKTTPRFKLKVQGGGSVTLKVDGANWFGIIGGGTMAVVGGMTSYVGLLMAASSGDNSSHSDGAGTAGLACFVIGGAVAALGAYAFVRSNSTDIVQTGPTVAKDAFLRTPSWRAASATEHGNTATFPLVFERRF